MLQEHKFRSTQAQQLRNKLWRGTQTWCLEATMGYNNNPDDNGAGKGDVATLLAPKWAQLITEQGSALQNMAHWFIIRGTPGGDLGFVNIYASNSSNKRCLLWEQPIVFLPNSCRWAFIGDFNMVELRSDKTNQYRRIISQ
jgi:hypothetical protein